jgi:hypothetical protein
MTPANFEIIFREFGQVSNKLLDRVKGIDRLFSLACRLAAVPVECISLDSPTGAGSTFSVTLPRVYEAPQDPDAIEQT